jgi:acid phosphatase
MTHEHASLALRLVPTLAACFAAAVLVGCGSGDDNTVPLADSGRDVSADQTADQGGQDVTSDVPTKSDGGDGSTDAGDGGHAAEGGDAGDGGVSLNSINHFVVIYMENHSFDNLYGEFPGATGLTGLDAGAPNVQQLNGPDGGPYATLPFPPILSDGGAFAGASLPNAPFLIENYIPADADTPTDLNHIFFTEQIQIAAGGMNLFAYQSNALGLVMGYYHTMNLPVPQEAMNWTVCDHFYHSAFGGSFLNHQFLIAATAPVWDPNVKPLPDADGGVGPVYDDLSTLGPGQGEGFIWHDPSTVADGGSGTYYVVNTSFSVNSPHAPGGGRASAPYLVPNLTNPTIGDRLTAASVDWAWYSGGWNDAIAASADAGVPEGGSTPGADKFQYHHQPFIFFANYADGTPGRAQHLKDEQDFLDAAANGTLPAVSFVKPAGINNEHPNYTDVVTGDVHLMALITAVKSSPNWKDTAIIITYDEHGGFWDHVKPPAGDQWGPGSRVPTIVISPFAKTNHVDNTPYDTSSILATIERRWSLTPLTSRDQNAPPMLSGVFKFAQ